MSLITNSTILPLSAYTFLQDYFNTVVNSSQETNTKKPPEWSFSACCFTEWVILETIFSFCIFSTNWDLLSRSAKLSTWTDSGIACSVHVSATIVRKNDSSNHTHSRSGHFSAPVLSKIYVSYSWAHHPSLVGIVDPSRLHRVSLGTAQSLPPLNPKKLITFSFLSLLPCGHCSGAIMATYHLIHHPNEDCTVILTEPGEHNHSSSLLYVSPILTIRCCTAVSDV